MLIFDRKAFKSGVQIVREPAIVKQQVTQQKQDEEGRLVVDESGNPILETVEIDVPGVKSYTFKVADKGKEFAFIDEDYVLAKYSVMFTKVA